MLELTEVYANSFDVMRELLLGEDSVLLLLKEDGADKAFSVVLEVESAWHSKYSQFFGNTTYEVANISDEFAASVRRSTHLTIVGSGLPGLNNVVSKIEPSTAPPDGDTPYWRVRAIATGIKYVDEGEEA